MATSEAPLSSVSAARSLAVIDIGSSAIRMEIAKVSPNGTVDVLETLRRAVPLGHDCFSLGRIETRTINLAIEVLRGYQEVLRAYSVRLVRAVATSAVREASNQELFVGRVYMSTGISVEVVSGAEESHLLYTAVRHAFKAEGLDVHENALIVEQGSGHSDIAMLKGGEVLATISVALGTLRLANEVASERRSGPPARELMKRLVNHTLDEIDRRLPLAETVNLILLGSEARFAAEQIQKGSAGRVRQVSRQNFFRFARRLAELRPEQIAETFGQSYDDSASVVPALVTYAELLKRTRVASVYVPSVTLRDGLILDFISEASGSPMTELEAQIYTSAEALGRRYQFDEAHAHHVTELALKLFDALAAEHRLGRQERRLLRIAALLHDIGLYVGASSHHKHSEYLINASEIFGVRPADKALVACVARYHRRALPQTTHASYASLPRPERATVSKLAALLRIADALDRSHTQRVRVVGIELQPDELVLSVHSDDDLALERPAVRGKADLFREVFGREVVLRQGPPREINGQVH